MKSDSVDQEPKGNDWFDVFVIILFAAIALIAYHNR